MPFQYATISRNSTRIALAAFLAFFICSFSANPHVTADDKDDGDAGETFTEVPPDSFKVTLGYHAGGGVTELSTSDDKDLRIRRPAISQHARTSFLLNAVSPVANPLAMELVLEGSVFAAGTVDQSIELYNYDTNAFEYVYIDIASLTNDISITTEVDGDLSRFVEPETNQMQARIYYSAHNGTSRRKRYASRTDLFLWKIM